MEATDKPQQEQPALYAIVELFGHQKIAGRISEQNFGGAHLVRVDVPEVALTETTYRGGEPQQIERRIPAHTRSFGAAAIYSINWCDQVAAELAAQTIRHEPLSIYSVAEAMQSMSATAQHRLLTAARATDDEPF